MWMCQRNFQSTEPFRPITEVFNQARDGEDGREMLLSFEPNFCFYKAAITLTFSVLSKNAVALSYLQGRHRETK